MKKLQVFVLLFIIPFQAFSQPAKNELRIHLLDKNGNPVVNASVFISSLTEKNIYAKRSVKPDEFVFESIPPDYTAVEVYAKGFEPSGILLTEEGSRDTSLIVYRQFEFSLVKSGLGTRHSGVLIKWNTEEEYSDTLYAFLPKVIFVSKLSAGINDRDFENLINKLGLVEIKDMLPHSYKAIQLYKKKNGQPFSRYNCRELTEIRNFDTLVIAGNIVMRMRTIKNLSGKIEKEPTGLLMITNIFRSGFYSTFSQFYRSTYGHNPKITAEDLNRANLNIYKDSLLLARKFGLYNRLLSQNPMFNYFKQGFMVKSVCCFENDAIGEAVFETLFHGNRPAALHLESFVPTFEELILIEEWPSFSETNQDLINAFKKIYKNLRQ